MARLNIRASTVDSLYRDPTPRDTPSRNHTTPSPSPAVSVSSDKENRKSQRASTKDKRPMASSEASSSSQPTNTNKRKRLAEQNSLQASHGPRNDLNEDEEDKRYYDPEQNPEHRRKVRQTLRLHTRELHDRADEFMNNNSSELVGLIDRQNHLMSEVKQTADATIDARFLITASELTLRKSKRMAHGDSAVNVDMDEWVSKCITFMKHGRPLSSDEPEPVSTQARRNRRNRNDSDDEDDNDGNAMNWHLLGARACFPTNARPSVPSFLLGPLSVQKRVRATQRRAPQRKENLGAAAKPQEIKEADLNRNETSNLTSQCKRIRELLSETIMRGAAGVEEDASEDMDEDEARRVFKRHNLSMNYEVPLFNFTVNPRSFGQTVENLFHISFLVRDGYVAVSQDEDGLPTIRVIDKKSSSEQQASDAMRHQQIFSLDFLTYRKLIDAFQITDSMIPHRTNESTQVNSRGWYG